MLDLGCNQLTDACVETIAELFQAKTISGLSLRGNRLTASSCEKLAEIITNSRLKYLSLAENDLNEGTEMITKAIFDAPALHYGVFGQDCQPYGQLQYLDLRQTGLTPRAVIHLQKYIMSRFCGLRELQLGHSLLPESAFDRIIDAIRFNTSLEAITIKSCQNF